ncbi:MAG: PASTA domain-containing protein [Bacteroidales bacterium]|nr:MAG: PASTA domain-containing protein [Bacteroidales bacterium]
MELLRFIISKYFLKHLALAILITIGIILITLLYLRIYTHHGQARPVPDFFSMTPEEVEKTARDNKMNFKIIDSVYTNIVDRGQVVEQNPKPGFKVKKNRTIFLTINAVNPEMVRMPNLVGLTLRQANAILETYGLKLGKRIYVPDLAINNVLKQQYNGIDIEENDSIEKGSSIDLVLGKGLSDRKTVIPDLISMTISRAESRIMDASLNIGAVTYDGTVQTPEDSASAFVWKQNPEHDEKNLIQLGSPVYIWLTLDSAKLPLPDTTTVLIYDMDENKPND